ncbi:protein DYAD [Artemisia annua]|uniref:Protein DYAD n=1 Tax=Artemisia annua TaxID=35608 RepID=A0A2U1PRS0_ARTAN|nr:protein DYAD [Artemisia annua]
MISLNRKETCSVLHGPQAPLARQPLLDPSYEVSEEEVELGSVYEVNHTNLPPRTPAQLRSTRVVMVSEKTDLNVAIRYPSVSSLKTYFGCGITEMYPALDEKFVMGIKLARKVLKRQVPSQEFAEKKHLEGFWLVKSNNTQFGSKVVLKNEDIGLAQELKKNEMVRWGVRRQVMYIGRQKEIPKIPSTSSLVQGERKERKNQHEINGDEDEYVEVELDDDVDIADKEENGSQAEADKEENEVEAETDKEENNVEAETDKEEKDVEAETDKEENDVEAEADKEENEVEAESDKEENEVEAESDQEDDEVETKPEIEEKINDKKPKTVRKMKCTRNLRKRKAKQTNQLWQVTKKRMKKGKKSAMTDPSNRWSKERYMAAELSLLEAMKAKKAMIGNPITRPALRLEARKRIGDTGLLDHLLKHVANEVAPGGKLRFRRSHNASGTMEYWLEDADLLKIRKDAGVKDPFWTPPPGWKPGDSPIQDPMVAKELNNLKEELAYMKKEFLPKKVIEEELARIRSEFDVLTSKNKEDQSQAIVVSDFVDTSPKQVIDFCNFLLTSESQTTDDVDNSMISKEKCMKPVLVISDFLKKMQVSHSLNVS